MIVGIETIFSIGGQQAEIVAVTDGDGNVLEGIISYDSKTGVTQLYDRDEQGLIRMIDGEPVVATKQTGPLYFTITLPSNPAVQEDSTH